MNQAVKTQPPKSTATDSPGMQSATDDFVEACNAVGDATAEYSKKHPAVVMMATFFLGFYVGWKIKPW